MRLTTRSRERCQHYIYEHTRIMTGLRGENLKLIKAAALTNARANEVREFIWWLEEEGFFKHAIAYLPQSQRYCFEEAGPDESLVFGWASGIPRKHWKEFDGYRYVVAINFKRWAVVLHELAHCYCREMKVSNVDNSDHREPFARALTQMVRCFRSFLREGTI